MTYPSNANDPSAKFSRWVSEHAGCVRGFIRGLVRCTTATEDLVQETFRKAWQAQHTYCEEGKERSYLLCIADRLVVDYFRQQQREQTLPAAQWRELEPATTQEHPATRLIEQEQERELEHALALLTNMQRRVLLLRFYGELDFHAIAQQLELPLNTVLSHCHRGLQQLRKILPEH